MLPVLPPRCYPKPQWSTNGFQNHLQLPITPLVTKEQNLSAIYISIIRSFSCLNWNRKKGHANKSSTLILRLDIQRGATKGEPNYEVKYMTFSP